MSKPIIIVDMGGTLCDQEHRRHLGDAKDWDAFYAAMKDDTPIKDTMDIVKSMQSRYDVWIVTGRRERERSFTESWLKDHGIDFKKIIMRHDQDHRPSHVWKAGVFDNSLQGLKIEVVFEDKEEDVAMWRNKGLPCYAVNELLETATKRPNWPLI